MASISLLFKDDFEYIRFPTQIDFLGNSPVNHALTAVALRGLWLASTNLSFSLLSASSTLRRSLKSQASQNTGKSLWKTNNFQFVTSEAIPELRW